MSNASSRPTLVPGTYRLTQDVKNPKPDRCTRNEWCGDELVKAGSVFAVHPQPVGPDEYELSIRMHRNNGQVMAHHPLFAALVPFLEAVPEQPSDTLNRLGLSLIAPQILDQLCRDGVLTVAQIEAAMAAFRASLR